jgi:hypothetical protein
MQGRVKGRGRAGRGRPGFGRLSGLLASSSVAALLIGGGAPAAFAACNTNSGTIAAHTGVVVDNVLTFEGGIGNSGTISVGGNGIAIRQPVCNASIPRADAPLR